MPHYFFDTDDGDRSQRDEEGLDLPDAQAARTAALEALPDMVRDTLPDGDRRSFTATVRNQHGTVLYTVTLFPAGEWKVTPEWF